MLWLFVILGLLVFVASAFGFASTWRGDSILSALHFAALFFVAVGWVMGHALRSGWGAVLTAALIELFAWGRVSFAGSRAPRPPESNNPESLQADRPSSDGGADFPIATEKPASSQSDLTTKSATLESTCLLASTWQGSAEVFLASLRRGGQRDAVLLKNAPPTYQAREIELIVQPEDDTIAAETLEFALSHTFDWTGAREAASSHVAHVRLLTKAPESVNRAEVIRLHVRAHLALLEFAPALAMLWPKAGRLISPQALRSQNVDAIDVVSLCVSFRSFSLADASVLCDTVGLHALGLRDLEIALTEEPDDLISTILYEKAMTQIETGTRLEPVALHLSNARQFQGSLQRSTLPPDREVIRWVAGPERADEPPA